MRNLLAVLVLLPLFAKSQWQELSFNTVYNNYAVSFVNKDTGYFAGGYAVPPPALNNTYLYKTTDGGITWMPIYTNSTQNPICQLEFFTAEKGLGRTWDYPIGKTTDSGVTWSTNIFEGAFSPSQKFQAIDTMIYTFTNSNYVHITEDAGASWVTDTLTSIPTHASGNTNSQFYNLAKGFVWGDELFGSPPSYTEFKIFKTTDSMQTFQESYSYTTQGGYYPSLCRMRFLSEDTIVMFAKNNILRSTDFGTTWDTVYTAPAVTYFITMDVEENMVIVSGPDGMILHSTDGGQTFAEVPSSGTSPIIDIDIASIDPLVIYAAAYNGKVLKYIDRATAIDEAAPANIVFYPNPATDHLYFPKEAEVKTCMAINSIGQEISLEIGNENSANVSMLQTGIYVLKAMMKDGSITTGRIIKH